MSVLNQRFYRGKEQMGGFQHRITENKFMVTDNTAYIGKNLSLAHTLNLVWFTGLTKTVYLYCQSSTK